MTNRSFVLVNLIIITALVRLVAEKMYGGVLHPADVFLSFQMLQAIGLIPASGENVKGDLSANRITISSFSIPLAAIMKRHTSSRSQRTFLARLSQIWRGSDVVYRISRSRFVLERWRYGPLGKR